METINLNAEVWGPNTCTNNEMTQRLYKGKHQALYLVVLRQA